MNAQHIQIDPDIMSGTPCFRGTRVPIQHLFDYLTGQSALDDFLDDFPAVSREAAVAVIDAAKNGLLANAVAA